MPLCGFIVCSKILDLAHVSPDPFLHKKVGSGHKLNSDSKSAPFSVSNFSALCTNLRTNFVFRRQANSCQFSCSLCATKITRVSLQYYIELYMICRGMFLHVYHSLALV